ncbi:glycosyltransferase [Falsiroseomonas oryzae]|uniref:glycosyltransferase n=1 Tax=Falsiroseomonas oryzae TaxID=2766473 RepID=UPI0022EB90E5|nr:glycosyltransferase [Roseomonas sp. MO-31]
MIPRILHFIWLQAEGSRPWSLSHHVCLRSAVERIGPASAYFHCNTEPGGKWWELTRPYVTPRPVAAPTEVFGNPLVHVAHRADVLRLRTLLEQGGIYLDCDVLVHRAFDDLLDNRVVLGREGADEAEGGLCNAVILAEPGAAFLQRWYEGYRTFRSKGQDAFWGEHSVKLPARLAREHPEEVTLLPPDAFFWPRGDAEGLRLLFGPAGGRELRGRYANHLWETIAWWQHLKDLTPGQVRARDGAFHAWARDYVAELPDRYGAPGVLELAGRKLRWAARKLGG